MIVGPFDSHEPVAIEQRKLKRLEIHDERAHPLHVSGILFEPDILSLRLRLLDFGPGVFQGRGAVEDELFFCAVFVSTEVAQPLELIPGQRVGVSQRRFHPA